MEASATRVRYRQKIEDAHASATILGLMGKEGKKGFDSMLKSWAEIAQEPGSSADVAAEEGTRSFTRDFAGGGW